MADTPQHGALIATIVLSGVQVVRVSINNYHINELQNLIDVASFKYLTLELNVKILI